MSADAFNETKAPLAEGQLSPDRTAIVGREGHLYLWAGSNSLIDQYCADDAAAFENAQAWARIIKTRAEAVRALGASFVQLVIPDKSTLLPEHFCADVSTPTPYLRHLEQLLKAADVGYLSVLDLLAGDETAVKKTDTHLSTLGTLKLLRSLHAALDLPEPPPLRTRAVSIRGDLAAAFGASGEHLEEACPRVAPDELPDAYDRVKAMSKDRPTGHVGSRMSWRNKTAPIHKTALVFGNSYFALGRHCDQLSWHFARNFREYHFVWDGAMDFETLQGVRPDIVVCQTVERFLPVVPAA